MQPLRNVISAFCREIGAALSEDSGLPNGTYLEAERLTLSLTIGLIEKKDEHGANHVIFCVPNSNFDESADHKHPPERTQIHELTIEFRNKQSTSNYAETIPARLEESLVAEQAVPLVGPEFERAMKKLARLFGTPGFDSSARATVFHETVSGLSPEQVELVVAALGGAVYKQTDESVKAALHLIRGVFKAGPISSPKTGGEIFDDLRSQYSVGSLLSLIKENWKEQSDWLD